MSALETVLVCLLGKKQNDNIQLLYLHQVQFKVYTFMVRPPQLPLRPREGFYTQTTSSLIANSQRSLRLAYKIEIFQLKAVICSEQAGDLFISHSDWALGSDPESENHWNTRR